MKLPLLGLFCGLALAAVPTAAAAQQAPAGGQQQPAAPAAQQPPRPFLEGSKVAVIDIQRIAAESAEGKAATSKAQALQQKKLSELNELSKKLQADQQKLQTGGAMMNDQARSELERSIERQQKELQRAQQDAQDEVAQLQQDLQTDFQNKLYPIIQKVVSEKGIHLLFSSRDAGIVFADPGLDLTAEVIKRFDAASTAATPPAAPANPQ
ncbi:MAG TPA: OmpH family outer membrane protein [Vicinamibacterales bacterium]